jgi:hypothetical protein
MKMSNNMADRKPVAGIINLWAPWRGRGREGQIKRILE